MMVYSFTRTGNRHHQRHMPCQDYCVFKIFKLFTVMVLSDGCSTAQFSKIGSSAICNYILQVISNLEDYHDNITVEEFLEMIFDAYDKDEDRIKEFIIQCVRNAIEEIIGIGNNEMSNFSSTLIVAFIRRDKNNKSSGILLNVGDGFIGGLFPGNKAKLISQGENRFNRSDVTYFATQEDALHHSHIYKAENFEKIIISSDGLKSAFEMSDQGIKSLFNCVSHSKDEVSFRRDILNSVDITSLGDDCSAMLYK